MRVKLNDLFANKGNILYNLLFTFWEYPSHRNPRNIWLYAKQRCTAHSLHALHIRTVASFDVIPNALRRMTLFFLDPCCNGVPHCAMVAIKRNHTTSELVKRAFSIQNFNTFSYARILQYCNTDFDYWLKDCAQHIWKYIMTFMSLHIRRLLCISYVVLFPFVTVYLHLSILILLLDSS